MKHGVTRFVASAHFALVGKLLAVNDIKCSSVETDKILPSAVVSGLLAQEQVVHVMPGRLSRKRLGKLRHFVMVALLNRETIYIFILFLLLLLFFSSPNLSSRRLDVYHTSAHGVVLV